MQGSSLRSLSSNKETSLIFSKSFDTEPHCFAPQQWEKIIHNDQNYHEAMNVINLLQL